MQNNPVVSCFKCTKVFIVCFFHFLVVMTGLRVYCRPSGGFSVLPKHCRVSVSDFNFDPNWYFANVLYSKVCVCRRRGDLGGGGFCGLAASIL